MNRFFTAFATAAILPVAACTSAPPTPGPQPTPPPPTGEYRGLVTLDGAHRVASLSVVPAGQGLQAVLHVTGAALAFGSADWSDGTLYLGFDYGGENPKCAGRLHLVTQPALAGVRLTGAASSSAGGALSLSGDALSLTPNALRLPKGTLELAGGMPGLAGELHARDCTGSARGSFAFGLYSAVH